MPIIFKSLFASTNNWHCAHKCGIIDKLLKRCFLMPQISHASAEKERAVEIKVKNNKSRRWEISSRLLCSIIQHLNVFVYLVTSAVFI